MAGSEHQFQGSKQIGASTSWRALVPYALGWGASIALPKCARGGPAILGSHTARMACGVRRFANPSPWSVWEERGVLQHENRPPYLECVFPCPCPTLVCAAVVGPPPPVHTRCMQPTPAFHYIASLAVPAAPGAAPSRFPPVTFLLLQKPHPPPLQTRTTHTTTLSIA